MRWFGGYEGPTPVPRPVGTRFLWKRSRSVWISEDFPTAWVRTAETPVRSVAVLGVCGAPERAVVDLAEHGVPRDVTWLWPGSYLVVEVSGQGTAVWTDLGSAMPVFVRDYEQAVAWATSARLLASLDGTGPDLDHLVRRLVPPDIGTPDSTFTYFSGVSRILAGHRLDLTPLGRQRVRPAWSPRSFSGKHHGRRLRSALEGAVHARLTSAKEVTSDFSGGFDSTALALIAAHQRRGGGPFPVLTGHPEGVTIGGDLDYAHAAADMNGIRRFMLPRGPGQAPYQGFENIPVSDEPAPSTITFALLRQQLTWLAEFGSDLHMTGDGGDSLLSTPLVIVNDLLRQRRIRRAMRETARWARLRNISFVQAWRTIRAHPASEEEPSPEWLTGEAAARRRRPALDVTLGLRAGSAAATHILHAMSEIGRSAHADAQVAETFGVHLHNPYTDSQVIDTYLRIPAHELPSPTRYKPILAQALNDLFPAQLLARTTKGDSTADHHRGLREALPALRTLMDGRLRELGLIDLTTVHRALTLAASGTGPPLYQVKNTIAAEAWVRSLETAPTIRWEEPCPAT